MSLGRCGLAFNKRIPFIFSIEVESNPSGILSHHIFLQTFHRNLKQLIPLIMVEIFLLHELQSPEISGLHCSLE